MKIAYVDTSCLVAIALAEPGSEGVADSLNAFDHLVSSNLLEAEFLASLIREGIAAADVALMSCIGWVFPPRALHAEFRRVLRHGFARGADLWHLACALHVKAGAVEISFLTLDQRQDEVARALGFETLQ